MLEVAAADIWRLCFFWLTFFFSPSSSTVDVGMEEIEWAFPMTVSVSHDDFEAKVTDYKDQVPSILASYVSALARKIKSLEEDYPDNFATVKGLAKGKLNIVPAPGIKEKINEYTRLSASDTGLILEIDTDRFWCNVDETGWDAKDLKGSVAKSVVPKPVVAKPPVTSKLVPKPEAVAKAPAKQVARVAEPKLEAKEVVLKEEVEDTPTSEALNTISQALGIKFERFVVPKGIVDKLTCVFVLTAFSRDHFLSERGQRWPGQGQGV